MDVGENVGMYIDGHYHLSSQNLEEGCWCLRNWMRLSGLDVVRRTSRSSAWILEHDDDDDDDNDGNEVMGM